MASATLDCSDLDNYILINPVLKYGPIEIPVLSKKTIYTQDSEGALFAVQRNRQAELDFTNLLLSQHATFEEQLDTLKQEVEFALAKYRNAKDLQKLAAAYEQGQLFEIGYRGDMHYVPLHKENDTLCTQYVNEGAGRAVFRVAKEDMYSSVLPDDVGVLMAGNPEESFGNLRKIPPHAFYRILRFIPNVQKVGPEEIQQILEEMHARGFMESGDMYIYQVLFRESDMDAIGVEIEITSL